MPAVPQRRGHGLPSAPRAERDRLEACGERISAREGAVGDRDLAASWDAELLPKRVAVRLRSPR